MNEIDVCYSQLLLSQSSTVVAMVEITTRLENPFMAALWQPRLTDVRTLFWKHTAPMADNHQLLRAAYYKSLNAGSS